MEASRVIRLMAIKEARKSLAQAPAIKGERRLATTRRAIWAVWELSRQCRSRFAIHHVGLAERSLHVTLDRLER